MARRILRDLRIDKIAAVDRPCQEHATSDIMKRAFSQEERDAAAKSGAAMPDGSFPIHTVEDLHNAVLAHGRAKDPAAAKTHIISRAKALGATGQLPEDWSSKESKVLKELAKALGLPETASEADVTKAVIKLAGEETRELVAKNAALVAEVATLTTIVKMSDKHKAHADGLSGDAKDKFMAMDNDARDAACSKSAPDIEKALANGEAFRTPEGVVVTKSKVGDELYGVLKSQNDRLATQGADLAKSREDAAVADFSKRATDLGFGVEFGPTLRKAYGGDAVAQADVEKRIKGLQKQAEEGGIFTNFGKNSPQAGSAEEELMAKVAEVKKAYPKLKAAQAYTKAYTDPDNKDIVDRMKVEASA